MIGGVYIMVIKTLEFILGFTTAITIEVTIVIIFYSIRSITKAENEG